MSDSEKSCSNCQHFQCKRTGTYEYLHTCGLHQQYYPDAERCPIYDETPPFFNMEVEVYENLSLPKLRKLYFNISEQIGKN